MKFILRVLAAVLIAGSALVQPAAAAEKCVRHDGVWNCWHRPSMDRERFIHREGPPVVIHHDNY